MNLAGKVSRAVDSVCRPQEWLQVCNPTRHSHLGFDLLCLITLSICFIIVSEKGGCSESLHMAGRTKPHPRYPKVQNICLNLSGPQRCALAAFENLLLVFAMNLSPQE